MKKALLICNSSQNVYTFRLPLIRKLESAGYAVETVSFDDKYGELLARNGVRNHCVDNDNRSVNPFKIRKLKKSIRTLIAELRPDVVFTFMAKPNVYGVLAAHKAGVENIFSVVEGAGDPFIRSGIKWRLVRTIECRLYKKAFRHAKIVFFLNPDDRNTFLSRRLVAKERATMINGVGVDLERFARRPLDPASNTFVMVARMLTTKGVLDYCECARLVKREVPEARFLYLGGEGDLTLSDIDEYVKRGDIEYVGSVTDVRPYLASSLMLILPSYREGKPMSVMEAEALGRGVIVTGVVGCRDTVVDGFNGYLVNLRDPSDLADKCLRVLRDKSIAVRMGENAGKIAETVFDQNVINDRILEVLRENCSFS